MAGCPIIRFDKLKTSAEISGRAGHHLRTIPVKNADPERTHENQVLIGLGVPTMIRERVTDMTQPLVKRKDNVRCIEVFLGASDDYWDSGGDWVDLAKAHKQMLISEFGEKNIVSMGWHLDEGKPHGWAFVTPITPDGRLSAAHWLDGPSKLKQMLTRVQPLYNPLGMQRAKEGVRATHIEMHDIHAANAGNKRAKKQIDDELSFRAKNFFEITQETERKAIVARAELEQINAEKDRAIETSKKLISDAEIESKRLILSEEKRIEIVDTQLKIREEKVQKQAAENDKTRSFLKAVSTELKVVFQELPEALFLKLPHKLQVQLIKVFDLRLQEPAKPVPEPTTPAKPSKAATGRMSMLVNDVQSEPKGINVKAPKA